MATEKQIQANIRNAQLSSGPRTEEGKAASSRNALQTGLYARGMIIGHESPLQLIELEAGYTAQFQPANHDERALVDVLIHNDWMLRRFRWVETEVWRAARTKLTHEEFAVTPEGFCFINELSIARVYRLRAAAQKAYRETLAQLLRIQAERRNAAPPSAPVPEPSPEPADPPAATPEPASQPTEPTATSLKLASFRQLTRTPSPTPISLCLPRADLRVSRVSASKSILPGLQTCTP